MAVYTEVGFAAADELLQRLGLGALTDLQGIRSGIENTNYYATTTRGQWVLTLFERLSAEQLPYYLELMRHLAAHGIPVPAPQPAADGSLVQEVILATSFTAEGEATAHALGEALRARGLRVTRLARGVPAGSELEYVDLSTIAHAMVDRR